MPDDKEEVAKKVLGGLEKLERKLSGQKCSTCGAEGPDNIFNCETCGKEICTECYNMTMDAEMICQDCVRSRGLTPDDLQF
ncbi:hypothetical protein EU528_15145 [Candidatus Thorarchaeota archaeon]|nr:MAG: hypothetical protein EU528_15145 [Candidatus Thorarchaeota archaeon]